MDLYKKCQFFLTDILGADQIKHSGRSLYDHLWQTASLLWQWDQKEPIIMAGLFHSIYGTSQFLTVAFPQTERGREIIANIIGKEAEELAYEFCQANRRAFPWALKHQHELYTIEAANLIEQKEPSPYVKRLEPYLKGKALEAVQQYYG